MTSLEREIDESSAVFIHIYATDIMDTPNSSYSSISEYDENVYDERNFLPWILNDC